MDKRDFIFLCIAVATVFALGIAVAATAPLSPYAMWAAIVGIVIMMGMVSWIQ